MILEFKFKTGEVVEVATYRAFIDTIEVDGMIVKYVKMFGSVAEGKAGAYPLDCLTLIKDR